ncbi:UDP-N-acetylmuramoyl-L-alanine--D-glutamate ligase [Candidatus Saccharibacteria bacterium CG11_big_fil_rev_8_21_14_0_20_41_19]|nr:UDP-N-acetylmuramoyl-L-alanine--D-glutamate ligase [Candidatus Saccharibacteria bacterium]OIP85762.1 MAG: UDP-N-acetylmuramoylalanine--D-glutamate ligase [Candidatus Saccharibacteria bacterium CG2_30_41_52]PIQ70878.1 MAG: UDP-N-acetylmuramoyl-L-alanine--D-glutamate ligase [Candidatus Saccharibacteria bacterium CG11_big_fil_rev_8_21_14_0_20_41_19]PIZ61207.1 MAG: UDP-N-acetylmuramoyl-L-alanine--D-glutamate ligase [Candidatus Saccharibacteria bacterium CG_4_10_14_0_2_um_filter_41_11]PJC29667.1 
MKIAIAGYGVEGESNYRYWSADPKNEITIFDENKLDIPEPDKRFAIIGTGVFTQMNGYDLVVRTAGLALRKIVTDGKIWSATNEFFAKCSAQIIGVTGSKGKGTTASLITSILRVAGKKVWLVGNIGTPALDVIDQIAVNDIVVYELSSFQLWDLKKSPHVAVILFIEQEHLDVHVDMAEYVNAKSNITNYQKAGDILIYNQFNAYASEIARTSKAKIIGYTDVKTAHVSNGHFYYGEQKICSVNTLQIIGRHNFDNSCAAIDAVWEHTHDTEVMERGLHDFKGLPHRLQFVREVAGIKYYDDSIATTPGSAIAALQSFDTSKVIILGGSSKGSDFRDLAKELNQHDVKAILIGDEATNIAESCNAAGFTEYQIINHAVMSDVVNLAQSISIPNGVVLLSPASASFGLFKNYADRGEQFKTAVEMLQ